MRVRWTLRALQDLEDQCAYIAQNDPEFAAQQGFDVFRRVEALGEFPYRGRPGRDEGTRELPLAGTPWIAVYEVDSEGVLILRLWHGAQDWPRE